MAKKRRIAQAASAQASPAKKGKKRISHETSDALLQEANAQTKAIMRLQVYKRAAYSLVAIGVLMMLWGFVGGAGTSWGIGGIVCLVLGIPCSIVLYIGIKHGKQNVNNMLDDYAILHGQKPATREEIDSQIMGETPRVMQKAIDAATARAEGTVKKHRAK